MEPKTIYVLYLRLRPGRRAVGRCSNSGGEMGCTVSPYIMHRLEGANRQSGQRRQSWSRRMHAQQHTYIYRVDCLPISPGSRAGARWQIFPEIDSANVQKIQGVHTRAATTARR